jgi:hypothetical protein
VRCRAQWRAVVAACALLAGCGGGGGPLEPGGGFEPPSGAVSAGQRQHHERVEQVPAYRLEKPREGTPLRYRVRLRNGGDEPVTVTGVDDDEDVDGQFVSQRLGAPVRLAPGATGTVEVVGRIGRCAERAAGQLTEKVEQRFRYRTGGDEHTQTVDLDAYLEIVSPEDAGCPSRGG